MFHRKPFPSPLFRTKNGDLEMEEKAHTWQYYKHIITGTDKAMSPGKPVGLAKPRCSPAVSWFTTQSL